MRREKRAKKREWSKKQVVGDDDGDRADVGAGVGVSESGANNKRAEDGMPVDGDEDAPISGEDEEDWAEYAKENKQAKKKARAQQSSGFAEL